MPRMPVRRGGHGCFDGITDLNLEFSRVVRRNVPAF